MLPNRSGTCSVYRGFIHAGQLTSVGFKHGRWLDTLLLQRSLT